MNTALSLAGSTAMIPLVQAAIRDVRLRNHRISVSHFESGSLIGYVDLLTESVDAALSDIGLEAEAGLEVHHVAAVTIAFVVNPASGVVALTKRQLIDALLGRAVNWAQLGGADCDIVVVNRTRASGIRACVERNVLPGFDIADSGTVAQSDRAAAVKVASIPGAMSYVTVPAARGLDVELVAIDDIEPTNDNVLNRRYPLWTYERVVGFPGISGALQLFIDCVKQCPEICEEMNYIPFERMSRGRYAASA